MKEADEVLNIVFNMPRAIISGFNDRESHIG
jgi:hypothetical protein